MKIDRVAPITTTVTNIFLDDEDLYEKIAALPQAENNHINSPQNWRATPRRRKSLGNAREGARGAKSTRTRIYLSGTLTIFDADGLIIPTHIDRYDTITLQPVSDIAYARLIAASPGEVLRLLGDYYASGNLVVRVVTLK